MESHLREQLLKLLENNSRLTNGELAVMLDVREQEVAAEIAALEQEHVICGYHTLINWDKFNDNDVTALVELRVTPQGGNGYQELADRIRQYPQVLTLYLMSGAYDFLVTVKGHTLKEISLFVSEKLASINEVQSTTTHFALTKYKELGVDLASKKSDERMMMTP
ncbi:MAG: Lrp/AsnC family transcriptional regulator [Eubacteriales bacterium]|nr:Lrp/AsnC family transcriptional regulator [Eubacteriales bacterium]